MSTIDEYKKYVKSRSERERVAESKEVTGAFTGSYAVNPFTNTNIPIWIAEYVLKDYGTGAIMAVPSDDDRDFAFADKFDLPVIEIIDKSDYPGAGREDKVGRMINSGFITGMEVTEAIEATLRQIESRKIGKRKVNYRLRDANYSRQRYWGEPVPIVYDAAGVSSALPVEDLPLLLPDLDDFQPGGTSSPLDRLPEWVNLPGGFTRETDTMPGFAGSSWYFLRYMDPKNEDAFASQQALQYWKDVDLYIGGTEHAVGHLMYSRFWHKFLFDKGLVPGKEPFRKLINQGMIQGVIEYIYLHKEKVNGYSKFMCAKLAAHLGITDYIKIPVLIDYISDYGSPDSFLTLESIRKFIQWRPEFKEAIFECSKGTFHKGRFTPKSDAAGSHLYSYSEIGKMSKRYYNVVNPDDVVREYGADCFRMYEMFLGPIEQSKPWDTRGIDGVSKFLKKYWSLFTHEQEVRKLTDDQPSKQDLKILHLAIKKVRDDIQRFSFNTCISHFMICVNELKKTKCSNLSILQSLTALMAPFAPFITEEIWEMLGNKESVHLASYPSVSHEYLVEDEIIYPVCINGKKRTEASFPADANLADIESEVANLAGLSRWLEGKTIRKVIVVPKRMINIVVT
jgi:leucyl-tRNA synthetase